jgi:hypothetical protein
MEFNLSSDAVINAGGALLFFLAGIAILAVGRRSRLGLRLGAFAVTFGLAYVVGNLVAYAEDPRTVAVRLVPALAAAVCLGILIVEVVRQASTAARGWVIVLAAGFGLGMMVAGFAVAASLLQDGWESTAGTSPSVDFPLMDFPVIFVVEPLLVVLLAASAQAPPDGSVQRYKGRLLLGLSGGLFAVCITMVTAVFPERPVPDWTASALDGVGLLFGVLIALTTWLVLRGRPPGAERFARRAFVALFLVALLGCLAPTLPDAVGAIGPYGILRTAGTVLLVLAVVKYDVLGIPLPRLVVRRGPLAAGALAVLFIVAQVAQNFFSAKYGLLMGGVLAGGFVFAASPVQRAIERYFDRPKPNPTASGSAHSGYKAALRAAMRDGTLTRREERHLAEVAVALGISPVQALDLRDEVERERA